MTDVRQGRRKWAFGGLKRNMQLFEQAAHGRVLQKDQFRRANHDLLVPVADVVGVKRPLLWSMWPDNIYGLRCLPDSDDGPLRFQNHAIAFLQDGPARKRDGELQSGIGPPLSMALTTVLPPEREGVTTVFVIPGVHIGRVHQLFNNGHDILKKEIALSQRQNFGGLAL